MKFAFLKQKDTMDCGPSCVAMIAAYYGKYYKMESLREECSLGKDGVSLKNIGKCAEKIGFQTIGGKLTPEYLIQNTILPYYCVTQIRTKMKVKIELEGY